MASGGQCLLPWEPVPVGFEPNGLICNKELDCKCYARKQCNLTDECKKAGGISCRFPDDRRPADEVELEEFCDRDLGCKCFAKQCTNRECTSKGGRCILPLEPVPVGYEPNGLICDKDLDCKCYTRRQCELTDECKKLGGKCRFPDDPRPEDEVEGNFCDRSRGCKCYHIKHCTNAACLKAGGLCVSSGQPVPSKSVYSYKPGDFCDKTTGCKCYRPRCTNTKCIKAGGQCFMPGTIPKGTKPVKVKYCNKKLKCKCLKVV